MYEPEIEFLDPEPAEDVSAAAGAAERAAPFGRWLPPGLWLVAAALAAGASSGTLYSVDVSQAGDRLSWSLDAWGRYGSSGDTVTLGHGPRLAVLMLGGAALLAASAVAGALRRTPIASAVGIAGLAATGTVAGGLLLDYSSIQDTYEAQNRNQDTPGNLVSSIVNLSVRLGPATWLIIAAAACGLAALAATGLLRPRRAPETG